MNLKGSILKNIFYLFFSTAFTRALNAFSIIILARYLGSQEYGAFSVAVAFSMVAGYFTDVGLSNVFLREGSKKQSSLSMVISSYIKIRVVLLLVTILASISIISIFYNNENLLSIMYLLVIPTVIGLSMQSVSVVYFQLKEQMGKIAQIRTISAILSVCFILLGMICRFDIKIIVLMYGISYIIAGIYGLICMFSSVSVNFKERFDKSLLTGISSFIISGLLIMLLPQLGLLVLEKTVTLSELGDFSVAYRIPSALYQIPGVVAGAFYPVLFRYYNSGDLSKHRKLNMLQVKVMAIMGMGLSIPLFHLSDSIISNFFGNEWQGASVGLKILSIMLFLQSINFPLADGLTTRNLQVRRTITQLFAVIIGIVLYYVFSSKFGVIGGAVAAVFIELFMLLGFILLNPNRKVFINRVIIPYISTFLLFIFLVSFYFDKIPLIATFINLVLVLGIILLFDKELKSSLVIFLRKRRNTETNYGFKKKN